MRRACLLSSLIVLAACGDAAPATTSAATSATGSSGSSTTATTSTGGTTATAAASTTGATANGGTTSAASSNSSGGTSGGSGRVVINEICGKSGNWIELYNPGSQTVSLAGLGVVDSNDGGLKTNDLVSFPSGTVLGGGEFMLLVGTDDGGFGGPYTDCMNGTAPSCFYFGFGISNSKGEHVYLVDANLATVDDAIYPAHFATADGQTLGRLPDGSGGFVTTAATPNAPNHL